MTRAQVRNQDDVVLVARAVADPTRLAVLRHVQGADGPIGVRALADGLGLHENAVRHHLAHLRDAGLVVEEVERSGSAGRPPLTYRPNADRQADLWGWNPYETLARLLVEVAAGAPARQVGAAYGRRLADAAPEQSTLDVLAGVAHRHGFQPTVESAEAGTDLVLGRCPFAASVDADRLVCELHRGVAEGIAAARGGATVADLHVAAPETGGCRFHIRPNPEGAP
jgi:predicted ArsR family transcriptional regulator